MPGERGQRSRDPASLGPKDPAPSPRPGLQHFGLDASLTTSYPTNSLQFLREIANKQGNALIANEGMIARKSLNLVIVGAGLGGLAAAVALARSGHSVEVVEQAPQLGEVGAENQSSTLLSAFPDIFLM